MTEVRTFRAETMQAALDLVRQEMGSEAVILHTRQVSRRRFLSWRKRSEEVEITAGLKVKLRDGTVKAPARRHSPAAKAPVPSKRPATSKRTAETQRAARQNQNLDSGILLEARADGKTAEPPPSRPTRSSLRSADHGRAAQPAQSSSAPDPAALFSDKLESIQRMLAELGRSGSLRKAEDIPGELFSLYTELIDADVEEEVARGLVFRVKENGTPKQLADTKAAKALLTALVESDIRCSDPIRPVPGKRKVVALVGTTGVGKTTTIAKLAANFRLRDGIRMGLVTVDTYRIAAVEQLRTYAEIIDLPMKVVTSPPEMRRAIDELAGLDLILIDTAGRSPRDDLQIQELKSLLAEAEVDEVHLVMSLTSSLKSLLATAERFGAASATSMILTKLDEAAGLGSLLSLVRRVDLPISYLTTGQDVPDDIEPARASRIARLVLGQDKLVD